MFFNKLWCDITIRFVTINFQSFPLFCYTMYYTVQFQYG
jgi:hypothetical protein